MALVHQHAVDALRVDAAWVLICGLAVAAGDLGKVGSDDLDLTYGPVNLRETEKVPYAVDGDTLSRYNGCIIAKAEMQKNG